MEKLAKVELLQPSERKCLGRPKKTFDHAKLDTLRVAAPETSTELIERLLILDARTIDRETQHELIRILAQLVHVRRAWKADFLEYGCIHCPPPDPTITIAARMRRKGMPWSQVIELVAPHVKTRRARKQFCASVYRKLDYLDQPEQKHPPLLDYGSGGLCNRCQHIVLARMRNRFRKVMEGRDAQAETAALIEGLQLKYNAAQRLLCGEE